MNLKRMANYFFLMICLFLSLSVTAQTQTKPLWVQKGEKSLEKKAYKRKLLFQNFQHLWNGCQPFRETTFPTSFRTYP